MKTIYKSIFVALLALSGLKATSQVTIGSGTETNLNVPIYAWYGFSYSQCIYLSSEIGSSMLITSIKYYTTSGTTLNNSNDWTVFIGHTSKTSFADGNDWEPVANLTQVFSGIINVVGDEVTVVLDVPFNYNGTDNLIIAVDENAPSWGASTDKFYQSIVSDNRSIVYYSDPINTDPAAPNTGSIAPAIANVTLFTGLPSACSTPNQLGASNITSNSADLTWTENGTADTWNVEWGVQGFSQGSGTMITGTQNNPNSLSGLVGNTNYSFYVQADCGLDGTSNWAGPFNFTTLCSAAAISSFPWTEDFNSVVQPALPCGWAIENTNSDLDTWKSMFGVIGVSNSSSSIMNDWAFTPELSLIAGQEYVLTFKFSGDDFVTDERLAVYLGSSQNSASMTTFFLDTTFSSASYLLANILFTPTVSGSYYVGFHALSDENSNAVYIEDLELNTSSCTSPTAMVIQTGNTLTAQENGLSYQWVDCNNSNAPISGEIGQSFDVTVNGNYAVEVTDNGCSATSNCVNVIVTGIETISAKNEHSIYPNPIKDGRITIVSSQIIENVKIYDAIGKVVYHENFNHEKQLSISLKNLEQGIYFIQVNYAVQKLIVE